MCQNLGEVVVRHTTENDWEILKMVRLQSLLDSPHAFSVTYAAALKYSEADWRARASGRSQYQYILAMQRTRAIGIVGGKADASLEFNVIAMWVNPEFRGSDIANKLISAIKEFASSQGHNRVVLSVTSHNLRAINFYSRHGFIRVDCESLSLNCGDRNPKMECLL